VSQKQGDKAPKAPKRARETAGRGLASHRSSRDLTPAANPGALIAEFGDDDTEIVGFFLQN
jgi:hypothetical protein